jgi:hypothetical protein
MRLTSTGLGIGTSSPSTKLQIGSVSAAITTAARFSTNAAGTPELLVLENAANRNTDRGTQISFYNPNGSGSSQLGAAIFSANENATVGGPEYLGFKTGTGGTITERARISSDGTFRVKGAGTAGSTDAFQVSGSAPASAMTLDASGRLLIGTTSNLSGEPLQIDGNGVGATTYTALIRNTSTSTSVYNVVRWGQNASGSAVGVIGTGGSAVGNAAFANNFVVGTQTSNALVFVTNDTERARITSTGNVVAGGSVALATTATDGFLYVPTCAGTPTGVPTAITGMAPIVVNTTNNKLYFYSGGAWRDAGP